MPRHVLGAGHRVTDLRFIVKDQVPKLKKGQLPQHGLEMQSDIIRFFKINTLRSQGLKHDLDLFL